MRALVLLYRFLKDSKLYYIGRLDGCLGIEISEVLKYKSEKDCTQFMRQLGGLSLVCLSDRSKLCAKLRSSEFTQGSEMEFYVQYMRSKDGDFS